MKYNEDLVEKIIKGLEEIPNIGYVFKKNGIHRSTYYDWIEIYPDFRERVNNSLFSGRENISDIAESNITRGIMEGNKGDSKWWLSHNRDKYMNKGKYEHVSDIIEREIDLFKKGSFPSDSFWESLFIVYRDREMFLNKEDNLLFLKEFIEKIQMKDPEATEIFLAAYADWKKEQDKLEERKTVTENIQKDFKEIREKKKELLNKVKDENIINKIIYKKDEKNNNKNPNKTIPDNVIKFVDFSDE